MSRILVDSGIGYLGNIPNDWNIFRIKNAFECEKNIVNDNWSNTQLLSLTTSGVKEKDIDNPNGKLPDSFDGYQYVEKNNIIMCLFDLDCSAVFSGISKYNGMISPAYKVLKCKEIMNPDYAGYYFNYISFDRKYMHYSKNIRYTLNYDEFSSLPMLIPPLEEQKRIASYLDKQCKKINEIINDNNHEIELIKEYANNCIIKAIISDNSPFIAIKHIFKVISGSTPSSDNPNYYDGDISWITPADYKTEDVYVENGKRNITIDGYNSCGTSIIPANSIIFSKRAPIGLVAISKKDLCTNQGCLSCVPKKDLNIKYFYYQISTLQENFELERSGTTFKEISQDKFKNYKLKYPDINQQNKIVDYLDNICSRLYQVIDYRKQIIEKLEEYKKSLIYECVTGKREV